MLHWSPMPSIHRFSHELLVIAVTFGVIVLSLADRQNLQQASMSYTDRTETYIDGAAFSQEERVAISLLTNLGAVSGNPDGTFAPQNQLNRAEFIKIALLSSPGFLVPIESERCFPDVQKADWFSVYVCFAKAQNIVQGYPDGLFQPGRVVNYVEAVKILSEMYAYDLQKQQRGEQWYVRYLNAAQARGVLLLQGLAPGHPLTRGQMAQLAAAFRVEREGELEEYRARERGEEGHDEIQDPGDTGNSSDSSASLYPLESVYSQPTTSHFLMLGDTAPVADGLFINTREDGIITLIQITIEKNVKSLRSFHLVDEHGTLIAKLNVELNSTQERLKWEARENAFVEEFFIAKNDATPLFLLAELRDRDLEGGIPGEILEVRDWSLIMQSLDHERSWQFLPEKKVHPFHQTVQGEIIDVQEVSSLTNTELRDGEARVLGRFTFTGKTVSAAKLSLEELIFTIKPEGLDTSKHRLYHPDGRSTECFVENIEGTSITCPILDQSMGHIRDEGLTLEFRGDIALLAGAVNPTIRVSLDEPGTIGKNGAIRWTDQTGRYNWVDLPKPLAEGPVWSVLK